jgi:trans-aconitate 2-methyltransferase
VPPLSEYLDVLAGTGLAVNAWETTYLHVLPGDDPVLEWFSGTGLRPYLDALSADPEAQSRFRDEIAARLRAEYPRHDYGTVLPFRRLFVVAERRLGGVPYTA